jgi:hypothetical protein
MSAAKGLSLFSTALIFLSLFSGCSSTRINIIDQETARARLKEPILLFPPISPKPQLSEVCKNMGRYYRTELPKRVDGQVIFANDVEALHKAEEWNNMMKSGSVNIKEVSVIAKTLGCPSTVTCQIYEINPYPPFKVVVNMLWIDSESGKVIGKLYQDIDLADSETSYRYSCYVGQGPMEEVYEKFFYSKDKYHTAWLMPQEFYRFAAAYSTRILFGDTSDVPWWFFWRTI